jgi:hypothetical protein
MDIEAFAIVIKYYEEIEGHIWAGTERQR